MVAFLVVYSVGQGIAEGVAGGLLAAISLGAAAGRIVVGGIADAGRVEPLRLVALLLAVSTVGYGLLLTGEPAGIAGGALVVGVLGWSWAGALTLAITRFSPAAPARAVGVMMTGLFSGAVAGPLTVGLIAETGSFSLAWMLCAGTAAAGAALAALTLRRAS